jgi:hypothetical protein
MNLGKQIVAYALSAANFSACCADCPGPNLSDKDVLKLFYAELSRKNSKVPEGWTVTVRPDKCDYVVDADGPTTLRGAYFSYTFDRSGKLVSVFRGR